MATSIAKMWQDGTKFRGELSEIEQEREREGDHRLNDMRVYPRGEDNAFGRLSVGFESRVSDAAVANRRLMDGDA